MNIKENVEKEEQVLCRRCGKLLRGEHSKSIGFGPVCYQMWKKERLQSIQLFDKEGNINDRQERQTNTK